MAFTTSTHNESIAMNGSNPLAEKAQVKLSTGTDAVNGKIPENDSRHAVRKGRYTPKKRLSMSRRARSKDKTATKKVESAADGENERSDSPSDKPSESPSDKKPERYTPKRRKSLSRRERSKERIAIKKAEGDDDGEDSNSLPEKASSTDKSQSKDLNTSKAVESDEEKSTDTPTERYTPRRRLSTSRSSSMERSASKKEESDEDQSASSKSTTKSTSRRRLKTTKTSSKDQTKEEASDGDHSATSKSERRKARKAARRKKRGSDIPDDYMIPKEPRRVSPERQTMIDSIDSEMKSIEEEIAALEKQFEADQNRFIEDVKVAKAKGRDVQKKKLKGIEMIRIDVLKQQGFDLLAVEEYLNDENKKLTTRIHKEERDMNNIKTNITKMFNLNKQSDEAVRAATSAQRSLVVKREMNKELVKQAELKVHSIEKSIFEHNTQGEVEEQKKETTKNAMKKILRKVQAKCTDEILVADVLQVGSAVLAHELGMSDDDDSSSSDDDDGSIIGLHQNKKVEKANNDSDDDSSEASDSDDPDSSNSSSDDDDNEGDDIDGGDDDSVSSVDVSLPESYYDL